MAELHVQLETDYTLHRDFKYIEASIVRVNKPWKGYQKLINPAPPKIAAGPAVVVGFNKVKKNKKHHLYLRLLDKNGSSVAFRIIHVTVSEKRLLLPVVINRD